MYRSLQATRAAAAVLVVLFHLGAAFAAEKYFGTDIFFAPLSAAGNAGVSFFFVLSGFIIMLVHRKDISRPERLANYLGRRLIRIYPTYWIIFLAVFLLGIASGFLRDGVTNDALVLLKSLLLIPQDKNVVGGTGAPVIIVAWSLQYEMLFYLCFALMIVNRWLGVAVGVAALLTCAYGHIRPTDSFPLSFLSADHILLFAMGMAIARIHASNRFAINRPLLYIGFGAALFTMTSLDKVLQLDLMTDWRTILFGLSGSLIILGLVRAEDGGVTFGGQRWVQILGDSSYALYLLHFPLISILCKLSMALGLQKLGTVGAAVAYAAILGACLASAVLFHLWVEKPMLSRLRRPRRALVTEPAQSGRPVS